MAGHLFYDVIKIIKDDVIDYRPAAFRCFLDSQMQFVN